MAVDFRGHPMFPSTGFNTPTRFEADICDCEVWGKIPNDIEGNFYRMQCDFQYRPPQNEWPTGFKGAVRIGRFCFKDGNVNLRSCYVKTARLQAERAAHKRSFGVYRNHYTDDPSAQKINRVGRLHVQVPAWRQAADAESGRRASGMPTVSMRLPNHSHLSEAYAVGTADQSLSGPILKFIEAPPK